MRTTIINHKKYTVKYVFNMVGNFEFTDKNGAVHLVDGEDVAIYAEEHGVKHDGINTAIAYAKDYSDANDGVFWWKVK